MAKAKDKKEDEVLTTGTGPEAEVTPEPAEDQVTPEAPAEEPTVDEKINETGTDAPVVEKPVSAKVVKPQAPLTIEDLRYAMRTLASMTMSPGDFKELVNLQPRVFGE